MILTIFLTSIADFLILYYFIENNNSFLRFSTPSGLEDVSKYPALFASLLASGAWSLEDLKKLAGINFLRVFREVEKVRLSKSFSTKWNYSISMQDNKLFGRELCAKSLPLNLCNWNIIKMSLEKCLKKNVHLCNYLITLKL